MPNSLSLLHSARTSALVISLDFELHWGVFDTKPLNAEERKRLLRARDIIPKILNLFDEYQVHASWATVGFLFAESRHELERFSPEIKPTYRQERFNPYLLKIGSGESDDPFHYAPSIIEEIRQHAGQEIASHSFSHYYCLEEGQTTEQFQADLKSSFSIAAASGYSIKSFVFPRNQANAQHLPLLSEAGALSYRGPEPDALHNPRESSSQQEPWRRAGRLLDSYFGTHGPKTHKWPLEETIVSIPASRYLSPYRPALRSLDDWRFRQIVRDMKSAAVRGEIFHLWWHPEDFAQHSERNLKFLDSILKVFDYLRSMYGMKSLSMAEAAMQAKSVL